MLLEFNLFNVLYGTDLILILNTNTIIIQRKVFKFNMKSSGKHLTEFDRKNIYFLKGILKIQGEEWGKGLDRMSRNV